MIKSANTWLSTIISTYENPTPPNQVSPKTIINSIWLHIISGMQKTILPNSIAQDGSLIIVHSPSPTPLDFQKHYPRPYAMHVMRHTYLMIRIQ